MRVYIAGPYTSGEPVLNTRAAIEAATALRDANAEIYPFIPHLCHFWHFLFPRHYTYWTEYDMAWLEVCDCLLRLPGESSGADAEVAEMERLGKPVFYSIEDVLNWAA